MKKNFEGTGIIIKSVTLNEVDKVFTIFTKNQGKIVIKGRGIKKITSRNRGLMEIFNKVNFWAIKGKGLDILTHVQLTESLPKGNMSTLKVAIAFHLCELVDVLTAEKENHVEVFDLLDISLKNLISCDEKITLLSSIVVNFEKNLLAMLGFGYPNDNKQLSLVSFIEEIIERPLKSRKVVQRIALNEGYR